MALPSVTPSPSTPASSLLPPSSDKGSDTTKRVVNIAYNAFFSLGVVSALALGAFGYFHFFRLGFIAGGLSMGGFGGAISQLLIRALFFIKTDNNKGEKEDSDRKLSVYRYQGEPLPSIG